VRPPRCASSRLDAPQSLPRAGASATAPRLSPRSGSPSGSPPRDDNRVSTSTPSGPVRRARYCPSRQVTPCPLNRGQFTILSRDLRSVLRKARTLRSRSDGSGAKSDRRSRSASTSRIFINAWLRAGAPLGPSLLTPVAVGTTGALVAPVYNPNGTRLAAGNSSLHPLSGVGIIDAAGVGIEGTGGNAGLWAFATGTATINGTNQLTNISMSFASLQADGNRPR
jgi:hypothetical protein